MPVAIKIKRFETVGDVPNTSELVDGEIAVNVADTDTVPVPSESIVAPPKLIVEPVKNNSAHLLVALPKFLVPSPSGNISSATALKSAVISTIVEPSLT